MNFQRLMVEKIDRIAEVHLSVQLTEKWAYLGARLQPCTPTPQDSAP
jgi:hypothetical protein